MHQNRSSSPSSRCVRSYKKPQMPPHSQYVALDCEMVGTLDGLSVLARVAVVNWKGKVIFDAYVKPEVPITDYRTFVSGITAQDLAERGQLESIVRCKVQELIRNKVVVGHGLDNDFACLGIHHPWFLQRDTAYYEPFMQQVPHPAVCHSYSRRFLLYPRKLKDLAAEKLSRTIQVPGRSHCPAEDAVAALDLYKTHRPRWEKCLQSDMKQAARLQQQCPLQEQLFYNNQYQLHPSFHEQLVFENKHTMVHTPQQRVYA